MAGPPPPPARNCPVSQQCPGPAQPNADADAWFQHEQDHQQQPSLGLTCPLCTVVHTFDTQQQLVQHQRFAHANNADLFRHEW